MLRKLNITLGVLCLVGALLCAGALIYSRVSDVNNSKVAQQLQNQITGEDF